MTAILITTAILIALVVVWFTTAKRSKPALEPKVCPTPNKIAEFVDNKVDRKTRLVILNHIAECYTCFDEVASAEEARGEEQP